MGRRVLVIGLDCAPPRLVFERFRDALPNLSALMDRGTYGPLRSTIPPITVPAWTCMVTGRDPGELGLYGFRNRREGTYDLSVATARDVRVKRLWDYLGDAGKRVAALFVPLTYPPSPVNGHMVSCFLTPGPDHACTFPPSLKATLEEAHGPYRPDVRDFRSNDRERILAELHETADQHFAMARHVMKEERPDFTMMVEMGPDRFHHAFYEHVDPAHPRYEPDSPWDARGRAYYAHLDAHIGALLEETDEDTVVLVVSDHGARPMLGGVRINEWLLEQGWLHLHERPNAPTPLRDARVDWARTRAFGEGGYYARVFLNVEGRDPEGCIPGADYERARDDLARALEALPGPDGAPMKNRVVKPEQAYRKSRGLAPDLMVFFGDLDYRSLGTVGGPAHIHTSANDTGPDACNHDWDGIFIMAGGGQPARGAVTGLSIYDVTPTVLGLFHLGAPPGILGTDRSAP